MKYSKNSVKSIMFNKQFANEDMRLLQKMTSGSSVYKSIKSVYTRKPKHYKSIYSY